MNKTLKSIKVEIGNKEYRLTGEPELVEESRSAVNEQIEQLRMSNGKQNGDTLSVLAALNIAEEKIIFERQTQNQIQSTISEIEKLTEFANSLFTK
jgi:cell division protein ZapA (FtsZ GTPase activity inhibitor)